MSGSSTTGISLAALGNHLYAIGGQGREGLTSSKSVERYTPASDTWCFVKHMNVGRYSPGVGVLNGKIYAVGGSNETSVEYYDPNTDNWTQVSFQCFAYLLFIVN